MNTAAHDPKRPWWEIWGTALGGWATALALAVTVITFFYTYTAQEKFNQAQLDFNKDQRNYNLQQIEKAIEGLTLQKAAAEQETRAAWAQREAAAVEALGRYLDNPTTPMAWESAEVIIDMVGDDPAWQATAKRALYHHPDNLQRIECDLYSDPFKSFLLKLTEATTEVLCAGKAKFNSLQKTP
jgi:hypothetical protein